MSRRGINWLKLNAHQGSRFVIKDDSNSLVRWVNLPTAPRMPRTSMTVVMRGIRTGVCVPRLVVRRWGVRGRRVLMVVLVLVLVRGHE